MSERETRIRQARAKFEQIDQVFREWEILHDQARVELKRAEDGFYVGEKVHVEITCRRGCCIEEEYDGEVVSYEKNDNYRVRMNDGTVREYVSGYDMKLRK